MISEGAVYFFSEILFQKQTYLKICKEYSSFRKKPDKIVKKFSKGFLKLISEWIQN